MKPFSSIFTGERGRVPTAIGIALIVAISVFVTALAVTNSGSAPAEADSLAAPAAHVPQAPVTSNSVYVKITVNGDEILGESYFNDRATEEWTDVLEYNHSVTSSTERGLGLPTGRRIHNPIVITKRIDKSSPVLFQALNQNESIDAIFEFERIGAGIDGGVVEVYYTVEITGGRITGIRKNAGLSGGDTETISIAYNEIIETNQSNGAEVQINVASAS